MAGNNSFSINRLLQAVNFSSMEAAITFICCKFIDVKKLHLQGCAEYIYIEIYLRRGWHGSYDELSEVLRNNGEGTKQGKLYGLER